ncbi:hypothetical protein FPZ12_014095 [Amycolatopsis acidicola]|uniref:DNA primase/polymerase bifunctional N-terminal domain-containing protein n=1 Tax=Amycolatopsis acidicola TaxID=2596893 RepID=A0A5N0V7E4_9PSEU|nr:hypothetical protein [Amycolatopsis acidicola]KAA9161634.1 hypothetical protein FPZ12_014095 [Amycolatopsis acidicola]
MRVEQHVVPQQPAPRVDYRGAFGWPVHWHEGGLRLVTGSGIGAVAVPKSLSDRVLESVARQGCAGPTLNVPTKHGMIVVLLVDADVLAPGETELPPGVRVLTAGTAIPLPTEQRPNEIARWVIPPDTSQRWLPSLAAVLTSIHTVSPARLAAAV